MTTPTLTGLRWSSARDCTRKAAGETLDGVHARDFTERERRILFRGKRIEDDYADWLAREHPDWTLERQRPIVWPLGTGHVDIYALEPRLFFEVLSSSWASQTMIDSKLVQLAGYLEHDPDAADGGVLVILDPSDFTEERIPLARGTRTYQELADEVRRRIAELELWRATGELPPRVCRKPTDAIGHFCRIAEWCFQGWEPPTVEKIDRPEVVEWAARWRAAKDAEREAAHVLDELEAARKAIEAELDDLAVPAGEWQAGPWLIRRTHVSRRPTLDARKVEAALGEVPAEWWKPGAEYDRVDVKRVDGETAVGEVDYGDVPF